MRQPLLTCCSLVALLVSLSCGGGETAPRSATTSGVGNGGGGTSLASGGTTGAGGSVATPGGPVAIDGVFNARNTGGLETSDGKHVRDLALVRSGDLSALESSGCAQLQQLSIQSVVDLRETDGSTGVDAKPDAACVAATATYLHAEVPKLLPPSDSVYLQILAATEPRLAAIFARLGAADGLPAILHCVIGRDRANIAMALVLLAVGVPAAQVVQDFTTNQDPQVQAEVKASWMQAVVDHVAQQGGIEAYLQAHGVTAQQLSALRQAALE